MSKSITVLVSIRSVYPAFSFSLGSDLLVLGRLLRVINFVHATEEILIVRITLGTILLSQAEVDQDFLWGSPYQKIFIPENWAKKSEQTLKKML